MRRRVSAARLHRDERGQSMVEFALVLPVLLLVLFAIVQFGVVFNRYVALTDAVRAGARKAAVSRQATDPVGTVKQAVIDAGGDITIDPARIQVTSDWQPGDDVTVEATYDASLDFGIVSIPLPSLDSKTKERVE
jgi:Flp pilus assembly protein TadG